MDRSMLMSTSTDHANGRRRLAPTFRIGGLGQRTDHDIDVTIRARAAASSSAIFHVPDDRDLKPESLERTRELMTQAVPDCMVTNFEGLIDALVLPDVDDGHVHAAAIRAGAQAM